jgi:hypothetical protein
VWTAFFLHNSESVVIILMRAQANAHTEQKNPTEAGPSDEGTAVVITTYAKLPYKKPDAIPKVRPAVAGGGTAPT